MFNNKSTGSERQEFLNAILCNEENDEEEDENDMNERWFRASSSWHRPDRSVLERSVRHARLLQPLVPMKDGSPFTLLHLMLLLETDLPVNPVGLRTLWRQLILDFLQRTSRLVDDWHNPMPPPVRRYLDHPAHWKALKQEQRQFLRPFLPELDDGSSLRRPLAW